MCGGFEIIVFETSEFVSDLPELDCYVGLI
jgi:hypothetical protein